MKRPNALCLLPFLLLMAGCGSKEAEADPKPLVAVKLARVEQVDLRLAVHAPAAVFPREQANIAARIAAPIRELKVKKGDTVTAGQVLAVLENRDVLAQIHEAEGQVTDARSTMQKTASGTLPSDVERARGQVATAQAALNQARQIHEKRKKLFDQGAIPQRDLLASETELATARVNHEVAVKSLELLVGQSRDRDIQIAESRLEQAQARLEFARVQFQYTELRSPFAGAVTEQFQYPGDMARPDAPTFTVMDLSVAIARAQVPETDAAAVRPGQACVFNSVDSPGVSFAGRVSVVNRAVDPGRRTVETWCEIPQSGRALRAGVFGRLDIVTGVAARSLVVPQEAVQMIEGTSGGSVFVVDDKKIAHKKDIETGGLFDGKVRVVRGLDPGEMVVVEGGFGMPDGAQVRLAGEAGK